MSKIKKKTTTNSDKLFIDDYNNKLISKSALNNLKKGQPQNTKLIINDEIKNEDKEKISIIIPTHNRIKELTQLLNSIFAQSYTNYEIIIIDDVSTDSTQSFFSKTKSKKIKYFRNNKNLGMGLNRQKGYNASTGKYVIFSDDDDFYIDNDYFKNAIRIFKNKEISLICSSSYIYAENEKQYRKHIINIPPVIDAMDYLKEFQFKLMKPTSSFPLIVRKKILKKANFEKMKMMNDSSIYLRSLMVSNKASNTNKIIGIYRVHNNNDTLNVKAGFTIKNLQEKRYVYKYLKKQKVPFDLKDWYEKQIEITTRHFLNGKEKSKLKRMHVLFFVLKNVSFKLFKELYESEKNKQKI